MVVRNLPKVDAPVQSRYPAPDYNYMTYIYSPKDPRSKFNYLIKEISDAKFKKGMQGRIIKDRVISESAALLKHKKNADRYYIAIITGPGLNKNLAREIKEAMKGKRFFLDGATRFDKTNLKIDSIEEMLNKIKAKF